MVEQKQGLKEPWKSIQNIFKPLDKAEGFHKPRMEDSFAKLDEAFELIKEAEIDRVAMKVIA